MSIEEHFNTFEIIWVQKKKVGSGMQWIPKPINFSQRVEEKKFLIKTLKQKVLQIYEEITGVGDLTIEKSAAIFFSNYTLLAEFFMKIGKLDQAQEDDLTNKGAKALVIQKRKTLKY